MCSESHFSVLFSLQPELLRDWRTERLFDLYYYDGLANQQEQIRLTVGATGPHPIPCILGEPPDRSGKPALAHPLRAAGEQCGLTRASGLGGQRARQWVLLREGPALRFEKLIAFWVQGEVETMRWGGRNTVWVLFSGQWGALGSFGAGE